MEESQYKLEDLVYIEVKCTRCGEEGHAPTFRQILEKEDSYLAKMLKEDGHAKIVCAKCHEAETQ